jgi:hypothetical protein
MATVNQTFGYLFGAVYIIVGAVGFFVTGGIDFAATSGDDLIIFEVNPLHNVAHLAVGALLFLGALGGLAASRAINGLIGVAYLALGVLGFFLQDESVNVLAVNDADNVLHIVTALLALGVALFADRKRRSGIPEQRTA